MDSRLCYIFTHVHATLNPLHHSQPLHTLQSLYLASPHILQLPGTYRVIQVIIIVVWIMVSQLQDNYSMNYIF
jgi:hypothetical protein